MVISRLDKVKTAHGALRHRNSVLMGMEKWYSTETPFDNLYYNYWKESGTSLKFTRWVSRNYPSVSPSELSEWGKILAASAFSFKLSCRHNDILRAGDSPHYKSCFRVNGVNASQPAHYATSDPDIAIVYVPDKAGNFLFRSYVRLVRIPDTTVCRLIKGNSYPREENVNQLDGTGIKPNSLALWLIRGYGVEQYHIPIAQHLSRVWKMPVFYRHPTDYSSGLIWKVYSYSNRPFGWGTYHTYDDDYITYLPDNAFTRVIQSNKVLVWNPQTSK